MRKIEKGDIVIFKDPDKEYVFSGKKFISIGYEHSSDRSNFYGKSIEKIEGYSEDYIYTFNLKSVIHIDPMEIILKNLDKLERRLENER